MPEFLNRATLVGLGITVLTAFTALAGEPAGFTGFRLPIWELVLQLNLCTGFVFLIIGVLQTTDTTLPDLRKPLQLLVAAFVAYFFACALGQSVRSVPVPHQLFLFSLSLACLAAGWARFGLACYRMLDALE